MKFRNFYLKCVYFFSKVNWNWVVTFKVSNNCNNFKFNVLKLLTIIFCFNLKIIEFIACDYHYDMQWNTVSTVVYTSWSAPRYWRFANSRFDPVPAPVGMALYSQNYTISLWYILVERTFWKKETDVSP